MNQQNLAVAVLSFLTFLCCGAAVAQDLHILDDREGEVRAPSGVQGRSFAPLAVGTLWDNGSFVTHPGGGFGGADRSAAHGGLIPGTNLGWGNQLLLLTSLADDFVVSGGSWRVDSIYVYAYQTPHGNTTPTINDVRMRIWDGVPGDPGSNIVWGDATTNVLASASWSGAYRTSAFIANNRFQPIMRLRVDVGTVLAPGDYWVEWASRGSLALGPFTPPIPGGAGGNARQRTVLTGWRSLATNSLNGPPFDELPFQVEGEIFDCTRLVDVVGVWDDASGRCGDMLSAASAPSYESTLLNGAVPPVGAYSYTVDFVMNRVNERSAATTLMVHGAPYPLRSVAQWWNRMLAFNISGDGKYSIYRYNGTANPVAVQKWAPLVGVSVLPPPAVNQLRVDFNGSQLSFVVNGVTVRTVPSAFTVDQFGIGFVRSRATTGNLATDDWLEIIGAEVAAGRAATQSVSSDQEAANARANADGAREDPLYAPAGTGRR